LYDNNDKLLEITLKLALLKAVRNRPALPGDPHTRSVWSHQSSRGHPTPPRIAWRCLETGHLEPSRTVWRCLEAVCSRLAPAKPPGVTQKRHKVVQLRYETFFMLYMFITISLQNRHFWW